MNVTTGGWRIVDVEAVSSADLRKRTHYYRKWLFLSDLQAAISAVWRILSVDVRLFGDLIKQSHFPEGGCEIRIADDVHGASLEEG